MSVGLLLITHDEIGTQLLQTGTSMLDVCPLNARAMQVHAGRDPDEILQAARKLVELLDEGDGVLVLTDAYGSTPGNVAMGLLEKRGVMVVAGVNLPMLIRILNYPRLSLEELAQKALSGGRDGILLCRDDPWN